MPTICAMNFQSLESQLVTQYIRTRLIKNLYASTHLSQIHGYAKQKRTLSTAISRSVLAQSRPKSTKIIVSSGNWSQISPYSSAPTHPRVAVIGGGISGLATVYYLIRNIPNIKITLYEASNRLGGWLESNSVDVGGGRILLESGPRTLRYGTPSSLVTAELIQDLGIQGEIITSAKDSVASKNRYVYYPDQLVRMPAPGEGFWGHVVRVLTEPIFKGIFPAFLEVMRPPRCADLQDESIGSFFSRRLGGDDLVNNIHSAVLHGIYAGDINQLSVRSLFPSLWFMEKHFGGLLKGVFVCAKNKMQITSPSDLTIFNEIQPKIKPLFDKRLRDASVYSFVGGIETLSRSLEASIRASSNIEIRMNEGVKSIEPINDGIEIQTSNGKSSSKYTRVISTLLPHQTSSLSPHIPSLALVPTVTVMVVNLYYDSPNLLPANGFGYLIPRSVSYEQNPECALGVVFDSDAIQGQDNIFGTKLTVMMGGHWWDGMTTYPDEEQGAAMAKAVLNRHLGINKEPALVRVNLQRDCIPQYIVGHQSLLAKAKEEMGAFNGSLSVTGCGYRGVGVNDCISAARDLVSKIKSAQLTTGLEWVNEELQVVQVYDK